jgi:hypothetical protein
MVISRQVFFKAIRFAVSITAGRRQPVGIDGAAMRAGKNEHRRRAIVVATQISARRGR